MSMDYLISILAFSLIISLLLIPTAFSQQSDLLNKVCITTSQNYTQNSTFSKNLKNLLDDLYTKTPHQNHLFMDETTGQGPDKTYGLALCRGDVSPDYCDFCLYDARCKITQRCYKKSAIVMYDYCQVKYSDVNFFGKIDNTNDNILINYYNVSANQTGKFKDASIGLLRNLSKKASQSKNKFGRGEKLFDKKENVTIYGMVQCTQDLSYDSCKKCLDGAVTKLPIYKGEIYSVGARVIGWSCTVRYEEYSFDQW
ncbi:hypothetical protein CASFOL_010275 [Castilleja foliolosa]|uniref:Gnk2-homologous domain-containing protein n=1 Tax=Castilleja foliolosa TaxID=1961234 RepID=A0ABD3DS98_9LAMI